MNLLIRLISCLFLLFGVILGFFLGSLEHIELFKLLNITGLVFDIIGLLVLSEFFFGKEQLVERYSDRVVATSMIFLFMTPIGMFLSSAFGVLLIELPSAGIVASFGMGLVLYVGMPLYGVDSFGDALSLKFYSTPQGRARFLG